MSSVACSLDGARRPDTKTSRTLHERLLARASLRPIHLQRRQDATQGLPDRAKPAEIPGVSMLARNLLTAERPSTGETHQWPGNTVSTRRPHSATRSSAKA